MTHPLNSLSVSGTDDGGTAGEGWILPEHIRRRFSATFATVDLRYAKWQDRGCSLCLHLEARDSSRGTGKTQTSYIRVILTLLPQKKSNKKGKWFCISDTLGNNNIIIHYTIDHLFVKCILSVVDGRIVAFRHLKIIIIRATFVISFLDNSRLWYLTITRPGWVQSALSIIYHYLFAETIAAARRQAGRSKSGENKGMGHQ